jgi:hypothetical protein
MDAETEELAPRRCVAFLECGSVPDCRDDEVLDRELGDGGVGSIVQVLIAV